MKYLIILFLVFGPLYFSSCVSKTKSTQKYPEKVKTNVSATEVVNIFLESLKKEDFGTAYDQIYAFSADREGYISRMNGLSAELGLRLLSYKILGTQLFKETAIIVAELETQKNIDGGVEKKVTRNKYDLKVFENEWKITKDSCIENCN
ncbi:MAG: hypothetical protein ACR2NW_03140 [Thermodesulfobacteriota bacterium]